MNTSFHSLSGRSTLGAARRTRTIRTEALERRTLLSAGDLDATLSGDGMLTTDFGGSDAAGAVALLPNGKMLVAGAGAEEEFAVARYTPGGKLDSNFGGGEGRATGNIANGDQEFARVNDVALLPDGKIRLVGTLTIDETCPTSSPASDADRHGLQPFRHQPLRGRRHHRHHLRRRRQGHHVPRRVHACRGGCSSGGREVHRASSQRAGKVGRS